VCSEQTGNLVNLKQISDDDDVMLIADDGQIIRIRATEISKIGRNTKGVRVMNLKAGTKIVCVAVTKHEEDEEIEGAEKTETEVLESEE